MGHRVGLIGGLVGNGNLFFKLVPLKVFKPLVLLGLNPCSWVFPENFSPFLGPNLCPPGFFEKGGGLGAFKTHFFSRSRRKFWGVEKAGGFFFKIGCVV